MRMMCQKRPNVPKRIKHLVAVLGVMSINGNCCFRRYGLQELKGFRSCDRGADQIRGYADQYGHRKKERTFNRKDALLWATEKKGKPADYQERRSDNGCHQTDNENGIERALHDLTRQR